MSLLDSATSIPANQAMNYLATNESPTRLGNAHPNIAPYQVMQTSGGNLGSRSAMMRNSNAPTI